MGIHLSAVHCRGEHEILRRGEGRLDDPAVCPCNGIAVAEVVAFVFFVCADSSGDGVSREFVVGHDCYKIFLFHIYEFYRVDYFGDSG
ncbi:hypothetical protein, partial [Bacteroides caecimuris]|uniref:hypothetical protein n=1 Tax=Bacteroides caecimuris TaxID=1796613 RepID=UPI0026EFFC3F